MPAAVMYPTVKEVQIAANLLVTIAHSPRNARGDVSSDQVRAALVRASKRLVDGETVSRHMQSLFGKSDLGYYSVQ